jgi:hypothetical protein
MEENNQFEEGCVAAKLFGAKGNLLGKRSTSPNDVASDFCSGLG